MQSTRRSTRGNRRRTRCPLLSQLLRTSVESNPDSVALRFNPTGRPEDQRTLTYRELDEQSSQLARELIARGVGPGDMVAVGIKRSVESVLSVWAVAKTGAAYVPVDPSYPADRIEHSVADSGVVLGLTVAAHRNSLGTRTDWLELDDPAVEAAVNVRSAHPISYTDRAQPQPDHPAYVIYTSGSTGKPKGVVITHAGIANVAVLGTRYLVTGQSRVLHLSSPSFDVSITEMLYTFAVGATLVIAPPTVFGGTDLADLLRREQVSHLLITPGALESVDPNGLDDVRVVVCAGDRLGPDLVSRWVTDGRRMFNAYGPTEATVIVTTGEMLPGRTITIGSAIDGVGAYILDARLRPVPAGAIGELYLSGAGLGRGYLNRPAQTAERFLASPFGAHEGTPGGRLYRTGDLVRRSSGSVIEYLGRSDFQVKIRGLRIELGEIENALTAHPDVDFAATLGAMLPSGSTALVAYILPRAGAVPDTAELLHFVAESLPAYMVPSALVLIDEIPLTPVGKLDRASLPPPVFTGREFRAPATRAEQAVADVFATLLLPADNDTRVGVDDDFFELGGNSLLAAQAAARISNSLDVRVSVQMLFEASSVAGLAARVAELTRVQGGAELRPMPRPEQIPLSYAQQRIWFLNRFDSASAVDNMPFAVRLSGELQVGAFTAAVRDLVNRHEVLRTIYPDIDGAGRQVVLPLTDSRAMPTVPMVDATEEQLPALITEVVAAGFDVTTAPPIRLRLLRLGPTEHVVVCVVHHIAGDGVSVRPLIRDLMTAYLARSRDTAPAWTPLPVQYADYTLWQREVLGSEDDEQSVLARQIAYWRDRLSGLPDQLDLPSDAPRPAAISGRGAGYDLHIDAQLHGALYQIAQQHNSTVFMVIHAALAVVLARQSSTRDIAIGTPIAGRGEAALDDVIGMFVNTLVLRADIDPSLSFTELMDQVRASDVAAFDHADIPFERLVEMLNPVRSQARHPLFQVMLSFHNMATGALELPGLTVSGVDLMMPMAKVDLDLTVVPHENDGLPAGMSASFIYAADVFDEENIAALADRLRRVLAAVAQQPQRPIGDIEVLDAEERRAILLNCNDTARPVAPDLLLDTYRRAVVQYRDRVAVAYEGVELTYAEFDARVNQLARLLIARGVGPESLVGLAIRRSLDLVVGMYAIVTAGGAWVPLDPDHPADRIGHILETAQPACVLTTTTDAVEVPTGVDVLYLDTAALEPLSTAPIEAHELRQPVRPENPAYVIFTSGSTGRPKGVAVSHSAIHNQITWMLTEYPMGPDDVYFQKTATTFDVSLWGYFMPLRTGAKLVVATHDGHRDTEYIAETIAAQHITVTDFVPSMLTVFAAHTRPDTMATLRDVFVIGEALPPETITAVQALGAGLRIHNLYGPTEAAVSITAWPADGTDRTSVPIGRPQWNSQVYVLDARLHPVAAGVPGELYLAGDQLARGYLRRPDLTADRFLANPFGPNGSRMYRTGDLVRWWAADAQRPTRLEYIGRTDFQVKFRGQRIELGEIETALLAQPSVSQTVAMVVPTALGDQLVAYAVPVPSTAIDQQMLLAAIADSLPAYMIPSTVVALDALPLNTSGKLDRKALPDPVFSAREFRAPAGESEIAVARVFADVLGVEQVGADDDFFALGGNSLLATRLAARLGEALETRVAVRELFDTSTVAALAARLVPGSEQDPARPRLAPMARPERVPLSLAQQRIWVINQIDPASPAYNMPFGIRLTGELDVDALRQAVEDVLERHEALRTRFPITDARPYQDILTVSEVLPDGLEVVAGSGTVTDRVVEMMASGFDVTKAAPVRARLFTDPAASDHMLVLVVHHIVADGASLAPLARDLVAAYIARSGGSAPAWAPLAVQYADFTLWQRSIIGPDDDENSVAAQQLAYWGDHLRDLSDPELPADRQRPSTPSLHAEAIEFTVPIEVHRALDALARDHRASLFMVIHAALAVLVARLSGVHDITIGTPVAGRGERALDDLVGMFANTLALRTRVDGGEGFEGLVDRVREIDLSAFVHADVPFERVVEAVAPTRNAGQSPLFRVVLSFQNVEQASLELPGLTVAALDTGQIAAKFDLQVMVEPRVTADGAIGEMTIGLAYATDLFDEPTVAAFGRRFERILVAVAGDARIAVGGIDILDDSERARLLGGATPAASPVSVTAPHAATLPDLLDTAVQDNPDGTAVVFADASETLSAIEYLELDERSSRLARLLIDRGVGPEDRVAVGIPRSVESVVAVWAIAKTGAAFVPVDPKYPSERVAYLVTDSRVALGLTVNAVHPGLPDVVDWLAIDEAEVAHALDGYASDPITDADRVRPLRAAHPAYVIYTSGSTGEPKGVVVTQAGLAGFCAQQRERCRATTSSRTLHFASPSFDASILELLLAIGAAATMVVVSTDVYGGEALASVLRREKVTHAFLTPAALASVDPVGLDRLRVVIVGGEACPPDLVQRWATPISGRRTREFYNVYGPTETTIVTNISAALLPGELVTIGGPIRGTAEYVLDSRLVPVPAGVAGELFIAGAQLARGYSDRPALTASRYVANPFGPPGSRLYRTGDLVRWTADDIEHLGRNDFQVKIRGFRIELGEIDAVLTAHDSVDFAVTLGHLLDSDATILAAYVRTAPGAAVDAEALIAFAAERLPAHMVPGSVTVLESIPLTPAGKVDRHALPAPMLRVKEFRAPHGRWETLVAEIYAELLALENPIGADDDFFDLGGNSLIATQVMARLGAALATHVPVPLLFQASTVAGLAARLPEHASGVRRALAAAVPRPDRIPLSSAQQRMWFLNQFDPASTAYNIPLAVRLSGALDVDALQTAVADVVARHEILRTVYPQSEDAAEGPMQVILPVEQAVPQLEVRAIDAADVVTAVSAFMVGTSFDVTIEVPLRVALFEIVDATTPEFVLALVIHHISGDGTSTAPLTRDLMVAYTARAQGHEPGWEPLPVQYADYTLWQHDVLGAESDPESTVAQQISYWKTSLADLPDQLELPTDRARPSVQSFVGDKVEISVDAETHVRLAALARAHNATLFMVVHSALAVLLARLSGASDIAIGTPMAGRGDAQLDAMIGMFVNTLVFRTRVDSGASFTELLARQRETDLEAFANADVPFERLVEVLDPARSAARHPLFQVGLSFQNLARTSLELPGLAVSGVDFDLEVSQFDLHWIVSDAYREDGSPAGIGGVLTFATALFDRVTTRVFVERFVRLLTAVAADPGAPVGDVELLDSAERGQVLNTWNRTARQVSGPTTLPGLLAATVARRPHATALISEGTHLSYTELDERVNRLARHLISLGVGPEQRVALALPRSVDLVVAMYAVSVAGGVYVPVDPDQPADRTGCILESATPVCVLTNADAGFETAIVPVVRIDELALEDIAAGPVSDTERLAPLRDSNIAYVIFTSGSTGRPKGVALSHGAVVNQLLWKVTEFGLNAADTMLLKTAATFDLSVWEFWSGAACGGRLVIAAPDGHQDPGYLNDLMTREWVTTLHVVPSMLDALLTDGLPNSLWRILAIGEALPGPLAQRVLRERPRTELFNLYGPTEAAVSITNHRVTACDEPSVSIGSPEWNSQVFVLDSRLRPVPVGVCGELYLAGAQLARGYFARPDLTADRFVAHPYGAPGERMYRTGDLAAWHAGGELEYRGRTDFQVKIRGFRIELGDIENALLRLDAIASAAVLAHTDPVLGDRLVAYVVGAGGEPDKQQLRAALAAELPSYMIPSVFMPLNALPLNTNGKLDRNALPSPTFEKAVLCVPVSPIEQIVAGVFAQVLHLTQVGADDDFFALGGNSLSATQVAARIGAALHTRVPVRTVFEAPTVAGLAAEVQQHAGAGSRLALTAIPRPDAIPLSAAQQRIWFFNRFDPSSTAYNIPLAVRLSGALDRQALHAAVADVVARHEILRTIYPQPSESDMPVQVILPADQAVPELVTRTVDATDVVAAVSEFVLSTAFDITAEVPLRVALFEVADTADGTPEFVLAMVIHHISADAWSVAPLTRDLMAAYFARSMGTVPSWTRSALQYADYTLWQREADGSEDDPQSPLATQIDYWRTALAGIPDELALPADRPRPPTQSTRGGHVEFDIAPTVRDALLDIGRDRKATLFMVLHAAFAALLARLSGTDDIVIGTPVAGRGEPELDDAIGMFVNTLALRTHVHGEVAFTELLTQVKENDLQAFAHAHAPFERLVDVLEVERSVARNPVFQVMLTLQNVPTAPLELPDVRVGAVEFDYDSEQFDLSLSMVDAGAAGLRARLSFARDLFDTTTAERFARWFVHLLSGFARDPHGPIGDVELLLDDEYAELTRTHGDPVKTVGLLPDLLARGARRNPDQAAVRHRGQNLSYRALDEHSNRMARWLMARGIGPESVVALALPRSFELLVAVCAVAKTGAAFVPVDPAHPGDRIRHMLADSSAALGISLTEHALLLPADVPWWPIDAQSPADRHREYSAAAVTDSERVRPLRAEHIAYLIYTSGSTGLPKAVAVTHTGLGAMVDVAIDLFGLRSHHRMLQIASPNFDMSIEEWLTTFCVGATLVVAPPEVIGGAELGALIREEQVTHALITPGVLSTLDATAMNHLELLSVGGDATTPELLAKWQPGRRYINGYGPTEMTIGAVFTMLTAGEHISIGTPVPGMWAAALDARLRPVPSGVVGELYLAGDAMARGYHRRSALTADHFVANPFGENGSRIYRTGDLVRWIENADGHRVMEYLGRTDFQVKIRGLRIELGEIDAVLGDHPQVAFAATMGRKNHTGATALVSYVLPEPGPTLDPAELIVHAGRILPTHMVPAAIVVLEQLPLTPVGKLDRTALPAPVFPVRAFRGPRTAPERAVCAAFAQVLGLESIGLDDNFFEHGGNSLSATRVVNLLGDTLGQKVPVVLMFTSPTPAELIAALAEADTNGAAFDVLLPLRTTGSAEPLFCIHPVGGIAWSFAGLAAHLDRERPLYGLQSPALLGNEELPDSLEDWARRYVKEIRTVQPTGPFHLLGWSLGGVIAHAMAVQLQEEGDEVNLLAMMDSYNETSSQAAGFTDRDLPIAELLGGLLGGVAPADLSAEDATAEQLAPWLATLGEPFASFGADRITAAVDGAARSIELSARHHPRHFHGDLVYFSATQDLPDDVGGAMTWNDVVDGRIHDLDVDATHWGMTGNKALERIGGVLTAAWLHKDDS